MKFQVAELEEVVAHARAHAHGYAGEVIKSNLLSVGIYTLAAGALDDQVPHGEDEVYYTVRGRSMFTVDGHELEVQPGSLLFVPAGIEHRFHDIAETLVLVVFWAPPEHSVRDKKGFSIRGNRAGSP